MSLGRRGPFLTTRARTVDRGSTSDAVTQALRALVTRRGQLLEMLTAERNRLPLAAAVQGDLHAHSVAPLSDNSGTHRGHAQTTHDPQRDGSKHRRPGRRRWVSPARLWPRPSPTMLRTASCPLDTQDSCYVQNLEPRTEEPRTAPLNHEPMNHEPRSPGSRFRRSP